MDEQDVAANGLGIVAAAAAAMGPVGGGIGLLTSVLGTILGLYGGSAQAPAPTLSGAEVDQIIERNLLKQDVRTAWADMAPTLDWYRRWTTRAKSGEHFSPADLADFDDGFRAALGPNSTLLSGLNMLYNGRAKLDSSPGQYGVPYLILGSALRVTLLQLDIARTAERGEVVSEGQWQNLADELTHWMQALEQCDQLAGYRVQEAMAQARAKDPSIAIGTVKFQLVLSELEIRYHGGASADGALPAAKANQSMGQTLLSTETARGRAG